MQERQSGKASPECRQESQSPTGGSFPNEGASDTLVLPPAPGHNSPETAGPAPAEVVPILRRHLETLYLLATVCPEKNIEQARAVLYAAELLGAELDPNDKALWICSHCGDPLGEEGPWDSYHDEEYEVYHTDCCPRCSGHHGATAQRS